MPDTAQPIAYQTPKQRAHLEQLTPATIRLYCVQGRYPGAERRGRRWRIPVTARYVEPTKGSLTGRRRLTVVEYKDQLRARAA